MSSFFNLFLDSSAFMPHGMCFLWQEPLLWLLVISDSLIALSYFSIPLALALFAYRKKHLEYKWIFILFSLFILACGATHLLSIITIWNPIYGVAGVVKGITALVSVLTAVLLWPLIPRLLLIPSPSHLLNLNKRLNDEIEVHKQTKQQLEQLNTTLDQQVTLRTKELVHINQELKESEEKYSCILNTVGEGIYGLDLAGNTIFVNRTTCNMLGYSEQELVGSSLYDLVHYSYSDDSLDRVDEKKILSAITKNKNIGSDNDVFLRKDGSYFPVEYTATPIRHNGVISGSVIIFHDISERKQIEMLLVNERNAAEETNKIKSKFLSRMSHELRTPMNAVLGFSQLLELDDLTEDQQDNVHEILNAGEHLLELINEVLELSEIESDQFFLQRDRVNLTLLIQESIQSVQSIADKNSINLVNEIHGENALVVLGDQMRLKQVIMNLLSNAIKYNSKPGQVTLSYEELNAQRLKISVFDTGNGMTEEQLDKLFEPFERLSAENSQIAGTGIGLVITKNLIELMGGEIGVTSTVGKGSCFWFELPTDVTQCF